MRTATPGVGQVFAALRSDFSTRRRERCVRVDFAAGLVTGVDDLERLLRDALKATFEARATAYDEEVPVLATPPLSLALPLCPAPPHLHACH